MAKGFAELQNIISDCALPDYMVPAWWWFLSNVDFEEASVLEVGGSALPAEFVFNFLGARRWVSVDMIGYTGAYQQSSNPDHYTSKPVLNLNNFSGDQLDYSKFPYIILDGDIADLPIDYFHEFDIIVSVNALEHILRFVPAVSAMYSALKKGGVILAQQGPIWSSAKGSHFWLDDDANFMNENILGPWGHLLLRPSAMTKHLIAHGYSEEITDNLVMQIYNSTNVNRLHFDEYEPLFRHRPFSTVEIEGLWPYAPSDEILERLKILYPWNSNFTSMGSRIKVVK